MNSWHNTVRHHTFVSCCKAFATVALVSATLVLSSCGSDGSTSTGNTLSSDATLSSLLIDSGTLTPAFAAATTSYAASVSSGTPFEIVRATPTISTAKVTVNGAPVVNGGASSGVALATGPNTITVMVTAQDLQATRAYTIVVTRAP